MTIPRDIVRDGGTADPATCRHPWVYSAGGWRCVSCGTPMRVVERGSRERPRCEVALKEAVDRAE